MATAAVGDVVSNGTKRAIRMMVAATANVAAPSAAGDGVPCYPTLAAKQKAAKDLGLCWPDRDAGQSTLLIKGTCTAGQTLVGTFTLWGYLEDAATWFEIPVNGGTAVTPVALAETDTDKITFVQRFDNLGHYDRIALQLASIGGSGASFDAWIVSGRYGE